MKKLSLILATSLMALTWSCNFGLMDDTDLGSVDWGTVDENTFVGKENEKEIANGDLILLLRSTEFNPNRYYLTFVTSSDNYYLRFKLKFEPIYFPIDNKGVLSFDHFITEGICTLSSKEYGPFHPGLVYCANQPCKMMINCDVKQAGGYHELESGSYGDKMKGTVRLKIVTIGGENYQFSFKGLVPFLDTSEWKSTGSPYE